MIPLVLTFSVSTYFLLINVMWPFDYFFMKKPRMAKRMNFFKREADILIPLPILRLTNFFIKLPFRKWQHARESNTYQKETKHHQLYTKKFANRLDWTQLFLQHFIKEQETAWRTETTDHAYSVRINTVSGMPKAKSDFSGKIL